MRRRRRGIGDKTGTFVSTWQTDNAGTSGATQITLPLEAGGDYDFGINWGDGSSSKITAYDQAEVTHTYPIAGTYKVKIDGVINGWRFNNGGDKAKITDISQWGDLLIGNSGGYFLGCSNLNVTATDVLDVSSVTNFYQAFYGCTNLITLDVSNWDVSNVTTFGYAFRSCTNLTTLDVSNWDTISVGTFFRAFRDCSSLTTLDVSNWDTSNVSNFRYAFRQCGNLTGLDISGFAITELTSATEMLLGVTIANYSDVLINWAAQIPNIQSNVSFNAGANKYSTEARAARDVLTDTYGWTIADGGVIEEDKFISTWQTENAGSATKTIVLPLEASGTYNFTVEWGDGNTDEIKAYNQAEVTHVYASTGAYEVKIGGIINGFRFNDGGDKAKITDISQWGDLLIGNSGSYFYGCSSLNVSATDVLDTSSVTTFSNAFYNCSNLTTLDVSNWDVSNVETFAFAFNGCYSLTTLDVSNWNTISVTTFAYLFQNCNHLTTLDVSNWDTSSVTNLSRAFRNCSSLDGLDISGFAITELDVAENILYGTTIANYSDVLINWAAQIPNIQNEVVFGAGNNTYNDAGEAARDLLDNTYGWEITDGGHE